MMRKRFLLSLNSYIYIHPFNRLYCGISFAS
nr:MAG TPA: hypothetical protein [Microviridae sp.]